MADHACGRCSVAEHSRPELVLQPAAQHVGGGAARGRDAAHLIERDAAADEMDTHAAAAAPHAAAPGVCQPAAVHAHARSVDCMKTAVRVAKEGTFRQVHVTLLLAEHASLPCEDYTCVFGREGAAAAAVYPSTSTG